MKLKKTKKALKRVLRHLNIYTSQEYKVAYSAVKRGIHYRNKPLFSNANKDLIFIHIPKAAGISVVKALYNTEASCHASALDYLVQNSTLFERAQVISLVRNPYTRLLSAYNYLMQGGRCELDEVWKERYLLPYKDVNDFIQNGLDIAINEKAEHFIPQVNFLYRDNELLVNFIGKIERVSEFERYVSDVLGREIKLSNENKSDSLESLESLTPDSISAINKLYKLDFEKLDYEMIPAGSN